MQEDGYVVWRKVPDDIESGVEETESDAHRVDVADITEFPALYHLLQHVHGRVVRADVSYHQDATRLLRELRQPDGVGDIRRERLLNEHIEPLFETRHNHVEMGLGGSAYDNGIEPHFE